MESAWSMWRGSSSSSSSLVCHTKLWGSITGQGHGCAADAVPSVGYDRNLEVVQSAADNSPTIHEGRHGMFNVHQIIPADWTASLTCFRGMAHTSTNHPACETLGRQFIAGSGFKPRLDTLEVSLHTLRPSCQPNVGVVWRGKGK